MWEVNAIEREAFIVETVCMLKHRKMFGFKIFGLHSLSSNLISYISHEGLWLLL